MKECHSTYHNSCYKYTIQYIVLFQPCDLIQHMLNTRMSTTTGVIAEDVGDKLNNIRQSSSKINMTDVELIGQVGTLVMGI